MSNEVNNLASSFVAMAQAFEKLPIVQAELDTAHTHIDRQLETIQRLEMRLMQAKEELDLAHTATRKAEVERDHAETMFLETDDKLIQAKNVFKSLIGDAGDFLRVVEPPKPEPIVEPAPEVVERAVDPTSALETTGTTTAMDATSATETVEASQPADPTAAPSWATPTSESRIVPEGGAVSAESVASSTTPSASEVAPSSDPTPATESFSGKDLSGSTETERLNLGKPYEGKRYTDVPFYVSLVEWLNGGGTEEAYYAR
jgi:hypothetical protein